MQRVAVGTNHGDESTNIFEIFKMVGVDERRGVDLEAVVRVAGVHKQAVHGVEHFVREQEKPFPKTRCNARD